MTSSTDSGAKSGLSAALRARAAGAAGVVPVGRPAGLPHDPSRNAKHSMPIPAQGAGRRGSRNSIEASSAAVADVPELHSANPDPPAPDFGYARRAALEEHYEFGRELGRGGNGVVQIVKSKRNGVEYACKILPKVLEPGPNVSDEKRAAHASAIRTEVEVLQRLRGTLNVACIEDVYEDDQQVYIVMEYCRGGELWHRIGERHYSEKTVASYMRAVLRTLAQCHSHHVLHRDVKPGNFMLLDDSDRAPLKAIDFGLSVAFNPSELPRSDLGLEGTPWFMAPETLSSQVVPASDVWSAGVMTHQLLTGRFPFDDRSSPHAPAVAKIWRSILVDQPDFKRSFWDGVSDEAKDFVKQLLNKDPAQRPSAQAALQHPWLAGGRVGDRLHGKPLSLSVVQRIQRYGQASLFKRTVLQHIAEDLLASGPGGEEHVCRLQSGGAVPLVTLPTDSPLQYLYEQLDFGDADSVSRMQIERGLEKLGYRLRPSELERLMDQLDPAHSGRVARSQLAASIIDWGELAHRHASRWLESVRRVFEGLDENGDGLLTTQDVVACLRTKLPPGEIERAVQHALEEASLHGGAAAAGLDFDAFLRLLRTNSTDLLAQYDDRMGSSGGSLASLATAANEGSCRGGSFFSGNGSVKGGSLFGGNGSVKGGQLFNFQEQLKDATVRGGRLVADAMAAIAMSHPR